MKKENGMSEKIDRVLELAKAVGNAESEAKQLEDRLRSTDEYQALELSTIRMRQLRQELASVFNGGKASAKTSKKDRQPLRINIKSFLAAHKGEAFRAADIAKALNRNPKSIRVTLFELNKDREIKRPARGMFTAKAA